MKGSPGRPAKPLGPFDCPESGKAGRLAYNLPLTQSRFTTATLAHRVDRHPRLERHVVGRALLIDPLPLEVARRLDDAPLRLKAVDLSGRRLEVIGVVHKFDMTFVSDDDMLRETPMADAYNT